MPWNENSLGLEGLGLGDEGLSEDVALVGHLGLHVVDQVRLREVVFVVRVWHRLEGQGHGGARLDVAELVHARGRIAVNVEELRNSGLILWELLVAARVELLIIVNNVVGLWGEQGADLLVLENGVENQDLVHGWLGSLVSDSGERGHREESEVDFPDQGLRHHHEAEPAVSNQAPGPAVIRSVQPGSSLPQVVTGAHSPLIFHGLEDIVAVFEVVGVAVGLPGLVTLWSPKDSLVIIEVVAVSAPGWLEPLVIPAWIESGATTGLAWLGLLWGCAEETDALAAEKHLAGELQKQEHCQIVLRSEVVRFQIFTRLYLPLLF